MLISLGLKLMLKSDWIVAFYKYNEYCAIASCAHSVRTFADICFQSFRGEIVIMEPDAYYLYNEL